MSPEIYMCYLIMSKDGNFKKLIIKWNREFKTIFDESEFRYFRQQMRDIRKNNKSVHWGNFNIEKMMYFISEHLRW